MVTSLNRDRSEIDVAPSRSSGALVLIVEDEDEWRSLLTWSLSGAGYEVATATDGLEAFARLDELTPDLIISDVVMPNMDGLDFLSRLRERPDIRSIPVILLTTRSRTEEIVGGLGLGADDYITKPFHPDELLARVAAKIQRPPIPADLMPRESRSGLLSEENLLTELQREIDRTDRSGRAGAFAILELYELPMFRARFGLRQEAAAVKQLASLIRAELQPLDVAGRNSGGQFLLILPEIADSDCQSRLERLSRRIVNHPVSAGERVRFTPIVGYALFSTGDSARPIAQRASMALVDARTRLDLQPVAFTPAIESAATARLEAERVERRTKRWQRIAARARLPFQIALTYIIALLVPFLFYVALARIGWDLSQEIYLLLVASLVLTCVFIWAEGFLSLRGVHPPREPSSPYPPATAVIAAYLPNEAATIEETIQAFLRLKYPEPLQIILAYNTPQSLPIEEILRNLHKRDGRFVPLRVEGSTSKAQNINAAVSIVTGEFVGIFDADHHPDRHSFTRAWRWLSRGIDVVQGHCLVRNGEASGIARMVAVEFEQIYAVSHPGRARAHGFGIFGGSNGYWKTELLRQVRMHGFMLTEDIDSSMRAVEGGFKIASDPFLVSRELAPTTLRALWNQRLRWAQGWFQVSRRHLRPALTSPHLSLRNKIGIFYLLLWREIFPWISMQIVPLIVFWSLQEGGWEKLNWVIPLFVFATLFTLGTGPGQTIFTYLVADPQIKRRKGWFLRYVVISLFLYTGLKNLIGRVAQIKELMGEHTWKITPRS